MSLNNICVLGAVVALSFAATTPTLAQDSDSTIDCSVAANQDNPACLGLPEGGDPITNFVPIVGPLLGAAALAGLGGSGGTTGTTSTTSTTSTTGGS